MRAYYILVLGAVLFFSNLPMAFAKELNRPRFPDDVPPGHFGNGPLCDLQLDSAQDEQMKTSMNHFIEEIEPLQNKVKSATDNYIAIISKTDSTLESATAAWQPVEDALAAVQTTEQQHKLTVLYSILKPEQRLKGLKCLAGPGSISMPGRMPLPGPFPQPPPPPEPFH